ncbi:MAG: helix-turn-helix transcriptional regulator [Verrucomicrobia bacterium]|nr:helix-turn-helix transcriptional regulator [Verrucomicrobiota bacterium]
MDRLARLHSDPDSVACPAFVRTQRYKAGEIPTHRHKRGQLLCASEGVITVRTEDGLWITPPQRAVWIASDTLHSVRSTKSFRLMALWVEPGIANLSKRCCVVNVDGLMTELLKAAAVFGSDYLPGGPEERLIQVLLDRFKKLTVVPLFLPEPRDERLKRITRAIAADLQTTTPLEVWARNAGITLRTAARLFRQETGMTFGRWRLQLRLLTALEQLAAGDPVSNVALNVGYADVSSFIAVFKASFGQTPAKYFGYRSTGREGDFSPAHPA